MEGKFKYLVWLVAVGPAVQLLIFARSESSLLLSRLRLVLAKMYSITEEKVLFCRTLFSFMWIGNSKYCMKEVIKFCCYDIEKFQQMGREN